MYDGSCSTEIMSILVEPMSAEKRRELGQLLDTAHDAPRYLTDLVHSDRRAEQVLVATESGRVVGALTGSYRSNWVGNDAFDAFRLPTPPHAYLVAVYVAPAVRMGGVGRALIRAFVEEALSYQCSFVGGLLDHASDAQGRRFFFAKLGFQIDSDDRFGASVDQIITW